MIIPNIWKTIHDPNHQPDIILEYTWIIVILIGGDSDPFCLTMININMVLIIIHLGKL